MEPTRQLSEGDVLEGKYRIVRRIGEGGMGVVFAAEHLMLKRNCAVKVLHPAEAGDESMLARFQGEAQSAANIRHPNIVEVMDYGVTQDGFPFFVMEFLQGKSLADLLDEETRLEELAIVEIADKMLAGLDRAHKGGVVHRDLKPENIFLAKTEDGREVVKILDFGISKLVHTATDDLPQVFAQGNTARPQTQVGTVLGTPGYMAPEAIVGEAVDARADLYAVGVMMYEMFTGRRPFDGDNLHAVLIATTTNPVPRPKAYRRNMTDAMERLIVTSLARDPRDRFSTAEEFIRHLTAAAVGRVPDNARPCKTMVGLTSMTPPSDAVVYEKVQQKKKKKPPPRRGTPADRAPAPGGMIRSANVSYPRASAGKVDRFGHGILTDEKVPTAADRRRRRRLNFFVSPAVLIVLALAGLGYYLYSRGELFMSTSQVAPGDDGPAGKPQRKTFGTLPSPIGDDDGPAALVEEGEGAPHTVTIWLDTTPRNVTVWWDGRPMTERPLVVPRSKEPVEVVFTSPGYDKLKRIITPSTEQTLKVRLNKTGTSQGFKKPKKKRR